MTSLIPVGVAPPRLDGEHVVLDTRLPLGALAAKGALIPAVLADAASRERVAAPEATLGDALARGDGTSPLLTVLLALGTEVESGGRRTVLGELLPERDGAGHRIAGWVWVRWLDVAAFDVVTRAPGEPPIVCVAVARPVAGGRHEFRVALGGHGPHPVLVEPLILGDDYDVAAAAKAAGRVYVTAADDLATGAIRSEAASVLTWRLLTAVFG